MVGTEHRVLKSWIWEKLWTWSIGERIWTGNRSQIAIFVLRCMNSTHALWPRRTLPNTRTHAPPYRRILNARASTTPLRVCTINQQNAGGEVGPTRGRGYFSLIPESGKSGNLKFSTRSVPTHPWLIGSDVCEALSARERRSEAHATDTFACAMLQRDKLTGYPTL